MKQNEYLVNKLDRQREIDVKRYAWEDNRRKHHVSGFVVAVFVVFCIAGWVSDAFADPPHIYSQDGRYLGNLSANPLDPDSVNNQYGRYGNPISPDSINNEYGVYGNPLSNESVNNPYATETPKIYSDD